MSHKKTQHFRPLRHETAPLKHLEPENKTTLNKIAFTITELKVSPTYSYRFRDEFSTPAVIQATTGTYSPLTEFMQPPQGQYPFQEVHQQFGTSIINVPFFSQGLKANQVRSRKIFRC